jgi:hypothetical protein
MPALTRRRDRNLPQECWRVYFGDVHVGTISMGAGSPLHTDQWSWRCGFYPVRMYCRHRRDVRGGARAAFETAWRVFLSKRTDADFEAWREHQAWTAEKYRRFDRGERMPPDWQSVQQTNLIQ